MTPDLNAPLSAGEFASLRDLTKRLLASPVPEEHKAKLFELGFIEIVSMEPIVTPLGLQRLLRGG